MNNNNNNNNNNTEDSVDSESFKTNYNRNKIPNHLIPLDFNSVPKLPDSHTWAPPANDPDPPVLSDPSITSSVPVIDLWDPNAASLVQQACEKWGMFQVTNHGLPSDLLTQLDLQTRRLFSLPSDQKLKAIRPSDGITGYGSVLISKFFPKKMWSEGFTMLGSPYEHALQLWPHHHDRAYFCNVMETYQKEIEVLSEKMVGLILLVSLGLTHQDIEWFQPKNGAKHPQGVLQLNSYPVCPDPTKAMGLAPHTDSSLLTILYQSDSSIGGLQVLREGIGWVPVQPVKGAVIVNLGDLMQILSNGRFKSVVHRAVVNATHHRISIAYFYGPPNDAKISPLIKLIDRDQRPIYRSVTRSEYFDIRLTHFNKALECIKIQE